MVNIKEVALYLSNDDELATWKYAWYRMYTLLARIEQDKADLGRLYAAIAEGRVK
jgi:hypothetical protein